MIISQKGLDLIKKWEKFSPVRYFCPAGKLTIGYGHVLKGSEDYRIITKEKGEEILKLDLISVENCICQNVKVVLNQNQFDAICSLVFNWGPGNFKKSKGLLLLNAKQFEAAKIEFFSKEKGVVNINNNFSNGLYNRRQAEKMIFESALC